MIEKLSDNVRVTLADVSRAVGCSKAVVSAVVNNARGNIAVSDITRERVLAKAREMGYRPNFASRSLARRATETIGIYVPPNVEASLGYAYEGRIVRGIEQACRTHGYDLLVINLGGAVSPDQCSSKFAEGRIDGVILLHVEHDAAWLPTLLHHSPNIVAVNYYGNVREVATVIFDDAAATRMAVLHLAALGHTRIAYLGAASYDLGPGGDLRRKGYLAAMADLALPVAPEWVWDSGNPRYAAAHVVRGWSADEGVTAVDQFLTLGGAQPTALVCHDDCLAVAAMDRLAERGLAVPETMSVVGIDDSEIAWHVRPALTSIRQPLEDMGQRAAELLIERAGRRPAAPRVHTDLCGPELRIRHSTTTAPGR